jgi:nucleoside phosphorylase
LSGSTIGVFYALDKDAGVLVTEGAVRVRSFSVGSTSVQQMSLDGHTLYCVQMGSGCVQTCLAAQALLAKHKCDFVISLGPVGDIKSNLKVGQWYRVSEVVAWQRGSHDAAGFRLHPDARITVPMPDFADGIKGAVAKLPVLAVASGEAFVSSDGFRSELASKTGCSAVDMNLFGLLKVMDSHGISGIHLRTVSDRADSAASDDFRKFSATYAGSGGAMAAKVIRGLPSDPTSPNAHKSLSELLRNPASAESRPRIPRSAPEKGAGADPVGSPPRSSD